MNSLEVEREALRGILINRNKLIEDLLVSLPVTDREFKRALRMRDENFSKDKGIWDECRKQSEVKSET